MSDLDEYQQGIDTEFQAMKTAFAKEVQQHKAEVADYDPDAHAGRLERIKTAYLTLVVSVQNANARQMCNPLPGISADEANKRSQAATERAKKDFLAALLTLRRDLHPSDARLFFKIDQQIAALSP